MPVPAATAVPAPPRRRAFIRRARRDNSQAIRRAVQLAFLALNVWIGAQFYLFVRQFETASPLGVGRPPGVEGWLPIAGLMNTKYFLTTGEVPVVHPASMFLLLCFLAASFAFRKAFCGWLCPVGTLSEGLWKLGRSTFRRNFLPPRWLDVGLRSLKYVLLGLVAYAVSSMPAPALREFLESPYGIVADVKMLDFFRGMGVTTAAVLALLAIGSIFVQNLWCRYLCPYGALMGLAALLGPLRIRRNAETCIDCARCAKACPSQLPVDRLVQIRSAECLGCLECVAACPVEDTLRMAFVPARKTVPAWAIAAGVVGLFVSTVALARLSGHWQTPVADQLYRELIPRAAEFTHPGR